MASDDQDNELAREAWNANARFWNEQMDEGNDFFRLLIWPAVKRLLQHAQMYRAHAQWIAHTFGGALA